MAEEQRDIKAEGVRSVAGGILNAPVLTGDVKGNVYISTSPPGEPAGKTGSIVSRKIFHICDRTPQVDDFDTGFELHLNSKRSRPIIVIVHGDEEEEHDLVLERLSEDCLPKLLKNVNDTAVKPIKWHEPPTPHTSPEHYWKTISKLDHFVSSEIDGSSDVKARVLARIPQITGNLLVQMSYYKDDFMSGGSSSLVRAFDPRSLFGKNRLLENRIITWLDNLINFWREWPPIEGGKMTICIASLTCNALRPGDAQDRDWLEEWGRKYQERADSSSPSLVVLSRLKPITNGDAKRWCRRLPEIIKDASTVEMISNSVSAIYQSRPDLKVPMRELIKEVKRNCLSQ